MSGEKVSKVALTLFARIELLKVSSTMRCSPPPPMPYNSPLARLPHNSCATAQFTCITFGSPVTSGSCPSPATSPAHGTSADFGEIKVVVMMPG
jgi:hypothetical protein